MGIVTFTESEQEIAELYVAVFCRAPDADGLDYWVNHAGLEIEEIARSFFDQWETQNEYPDTTSYADFVNTIYLNLFDRDAEPGGLSYWVLELEQGSVTRGNMILTVVNGAQGNDKVMLDNKSKVGLAFAKSGLSDYSLSIEVMSGVNYDQSTVESAYLKMNFNGRLELIPGDSDPGDPDPGDPDPGDPDPGDPDPGDPDPGDPDPGDPDPFIK